MGYLTPVLIRNDAIHKLVENPEEFAQTMKRATQKRNEDWTPSSFGVGNHVNPIESLGTQHASITRMLVVEGNSICDLTKVMNDGMFSEEGLVDYSLKELKRIQNLCEKLQLQINGIEESVEQELEERAPEADFE